MEFGNDIDSPDSIDVGIRRVVVENAPGEKDVEYDSDTVVGALQVLEGYARNDEVKRPEEATCELRDRPKGGLVSTSGRERRSRDGHASCVTRAKRAPRFCER